MTRSQLARLMVLRFIYDLDEKVDQFYILDILDLAKDSAKRGLTINRTEIVDALAGLVEDGLATASLLSPWSRRRK
ncbi:MAG TPA: hypothetical protein VGG72_26505 [Bryobacteraceae bacterium]